MAAAVVQQHATRLKDVATTVVGKEFGYDDNTQLIPVLRDDKIAVERCQVIGITGGQAQLVVRAKIRMVSRPPCFE